MMRRNRLLVITVLYCSLSAAEAGTVCPPVTRVGLSDLGYTSYRDQGRIAGISVDIANEMARRTGCKFEFHWYPRQRLFIELAAGNIDMTMGSLRLPERDAYARYLPYAYLQYDLVLSVPPGRNYTSLADFVEHGNGRLNVTRGLAYDPAIETQLAKLTAAGRLELVNDFETVFAKLDMGRADGTIATPPIYSKYLKGSRVQASAVVITLPEANPRFTGLYLSKKTISTAVRDRYAATLKAMLTDQTIRTIYTPYFDDATLKRMIRQGQGPLLTALSAPEN
ncbi:transporter substrate-binding domain-containing protein [Pseudoduganella sp. FT55W]|uniref:Transporter substrate-binding domain-containing protein n=1 Tax=Duganella rivi TaxID=2666083 RepID=A0A7X4KBA0_9BURK|nr:transporter substrate-binding domain-containing protein [Duganella rivi]MYM67044.1 transporter substrate-binding domain-containing protein [Duganella rivi]